MKTKLFLILTTLIVTGSLFAQVPQKMSYQAVIRDHNNALVTSKSVGIKISVLYGSSTGSAVYIETQTVTTNVNGLVSLKVGEGNVLQGTFSSIYWGIGPYYIKTETDPTGGTAYSIVGVSELLSVPYALYSANAHVGGYSHYIGESYDGGIIYHIYRGSDGLEHGLIAALTETTAAWQTVSTLVNANSSWDGAYNTNLMTNSPAKNYVLSLGAGWYIPSADELTKMYVNRFELNMALSTGGNTLISNTLNYFSSTELAANVVAIFDFYFGYANSSPKTQVLTVRAIKSF